jgi:hypothetical protein
MSPEIQHGEGLDAPGFPGAAKGKSIIFEAPDTG